MKMAKNKLTNTQRLPEGISVWEVHYKSHYYDDDERCPGNTPVDVRLYVLAGSYDEALSKSKIVLKARISERYSRVQEEVQKNEQTVVSQVALENLVAARDASSDGRLGWHSTSQLAEVQLSLEEDLQQYKLGVCLIPVKKHK